jgi:predicted TIM-barrel fold metal-dependent hydrolase
MLSGSPIEPAFSEVSAWELFDANVRMGPSGVHGEIALEATHLLAEMDRFGIKQALVSHFAAEEYDAEEGNRALARDLHPRLVPAWAALPDRGFIEKLWALRPAAVRLSFGANRHNFSSAPWCCGELYESLQERSLLTIMAREDIEWDSLASLLDDFPRLPVLLLETGYRADRYLFPLLSRYSNLYIDTSTYVGHRQLESFVDRFGAGHLVFGSRLPFYTPGATLAVLASARISEEAKLAVAGGTLRQLLRRATA